MGGRTCELPWWPAACEEPFLRSTCGLSAWYGPSFLFSDQTMNEKGPRGTGPYILVLRNQPIRGRVTAVPVRPCYDYECVRETLGLVLLMKNTNVVRQDSK